jgi:hypothetical protein
MSLTQKIIPLVLAHTMFATGANLAQADEFSFDRAEWGSNNDLLVYEGHGEEGSIVEAYISHTLVSLGRARVDSEGRWIFRLSDPDNIPCRVRIETGPYSSERDVSNAPSGCVNENNLDDNNSQPENNLDDNNSQPENNPPIISGTPDSQVEVGQAYRFRPTARDTDDDNLTFSITNRPSWANFNNSNGVLSGTPTDNDAGRYGNIVITVSDGTDTASLSPFNLIVEAETLPTTGDITLSWVAPSTRFDGTALSLSEIAGYRIYMGASTNSLAPVLDLEDGTLERYVMEDLENGTYYFAITAYDTAGSESDFSNIVVRETM